MNNYTIEKQFYEYCPIRGYMYHSNPFLLKQNSGDINENTIHNKMHVIVKNSTISNRTVSLTELKNLFDDVLKKEGIQEYDVLYDDYIYYRNQIINILYNDIKPNMIDILKYKYNNFLKK